MLEGKPDMLVNESQAVKKIGEAGRQARINDKLSKVSGYFVTFFINNMIAP